MNKCFTCLFSKKSKCVWLDQTISRTPLCGGHHWIEKPDHMYQAPEERVFPFQLDDMTPEQRSAAEQAASVAKKKALAKMEAFLQELELTLRSAQAGQIRRRWVRNFLNWKLGQEHSANLPEVYKEEMMAA
jgi:hypothetical protein